jgi:hypothetical protein
MAVYAANFTLEKGTHFEEEFVLTEDDGSPLNLVGYEGISKIRKYPTSPKYKPFSIIFVNREEGVIRISLSNFQTSQLDSGRNYYDILLVDRVGKIKKVVEGNIIVGETASLGLLDSGNLDGLGNIDVTNVRDGYVLMYDEESQSFVFVDPDVVLDKATVTNEGLPSDFIDALDSELDNRIDVDSGEF